MNIGTVSARTGVPAKTIRYYEEIGMINPQRLENGYRDFEENDLHRLTFIGRARSLGFTIEDCRTLLALYGDDQRASSDVKEIAEQNLREIDEKIADLQAMRSTLSHLIKRCHGDKRPDCPILEGLSLVHETKS